MAVVETHLSVLFFVGDRVYKLHKPVRFAFADFSDRSARQADSRREVTLNRRLAPDVYLGVVDVSEHGEPVDHLVVMRRLPADRQLAALARGGADVAVCLAQVARTLVGFHARATRAAAIDETARAASVLAGWEANFTEMAPFVGPVIDAGAEALVQHQVRRFLAGRTALFDERIAHGHVCDGHGDLQAEDVFCLSDGPRILDCITFDDRLRYGDVAADLAFLLMDLERIGAADAAATVRAEYEELSGQVLPASLLDHYIAARAYVRSKVACLRWAQQGSPRGRSSQRTGELAPPRAVADEARHLHRIARDHLQRSQVRLVLVGGLPGTGKSTLASALAERIDADVLCSDEIRKEQAGIPADQPAPAPYGSQLYAPEITESTYRILRQRAQVALGLGRTVVLDASWKDRRQREAAQRVAAATSSDLVELRCTVDDAVAAARIAARRRLGGDPSDATAAVAMAMAAEADRWPSASVVDTTGEPEASLHQALQYVVDSRCRRHEPPPPARSSPGQRAGRAPLAR